MKSKTYVFQALTLTICAVFVIVILNGSLNRRVQRMHLERSKDASDSVSFRWHPDLYRLLSFGHVPTAVDWLLIRFLTDGNYTHIEKGEKPEITRVLDLATNLDPAFFTLYTAGANFLSVIRNDPDGALHLLEKGNSFRKSGLNLYPEKIRESLWLDDWRLPFGLGYVYLFDFQDMGNAMSAYNEMRKMKRTPSVLRKMAEKIQTPEGQYRIGLNAISFLKGMYKEDETMTAELEKKEKYFLQAKELYFWNVGFEAALKSSKNAKPEDFFRTFRLQARIPEHDAFGGEIYYSTKDSRIASRTEAVPVLGLELPKAPVVKEANPR